MFFDDTELLYIFFPLSFIIVDEYVFPAVDISKLNHILTTTLKSYIDMHDLQILSINLLSSMHLATTKRPFSQCGEVHAGKGLSCT